MLVHGIVKPALPPFPMPSRFRTNVAYFMTPSGEERVPKLAEGEYWIRLEDAKQWMPKRKRKLN